MVSPPVVKRHSVNDRDKLGCTALHWAALNDRAELMRWLMSNGADKDAKANDGHSPLHWAALKGHVLACKALLDAGCCVDMRDQWMFTPLIRAAQNGHCLVVVLLLRGGADPSLFDEEQHNALHWAVFHRHHVVVLSEVLPHGIARVRIRRDRHPWQRRAGRADADVLLAVVGRLVCSLRRHI